MRSRPGACCAGRAAPSNCITCRPGPVLRWEHTAESLDRQLRRAEDIAGECSAADERFRSEPEAGRGDDVFPPAPGSWCGWCDFRAQCPEGRTAAAQRRPWDGLAADDQPDARAS